MGDHLSDPPPYEPPPEEEDLYEWEAEAERGRPSIIWGRAIALIVVLLLAFLGGRLTAGGDDGAEEATLQSLREENLQLEDELDQTRQELEAAQQTPEPEQTPAGGGGGGQDDTTAQSETYEVQAGQGFQQIAEDALGDIGLAECIAEANGLTLESTITPGMTLEIPPRESCN